MALLSRGGPPRQQPAGSVWIVVACGLALIVPACIPRPPNNSGDLCEIFAQKRDWHRAARRSYERWGVPEAVQLAVIHQESRFRADARPRRRKLLWLLPGPRPSTAYGYGQVLDGTWARYQTDTGNRGADRDDFADVADFIGWYGQKIYQRTGVAKDDAFHLYLAYHEGPGGFARGTHRRKPRLLDLARQVDERAALYRVQYGSCRELRQRRFLWF